MWLTPSLRIWAGKKKPWDEKSQGYFYDDNDVDENSWGLVPIGPPHFSIFRVLNILTILNILNILNDLSNFNIFNFNDLNNQ